MAPSEAAAGAFQAAGELEFDQARRLVADRARTPMGRGRALALAPSPDPEVVARRLARVREGLALAAEDVRLSFPELADPAADLERLAVAGAALEGESLRNLATLAGAAADLRRELRSWRQQAPTLWEEIDPVPDLEPYRRACRGVFAADGGLEDGASPRLRAIRRELAASGERLRRRMEGYLGAPDADRTLQDEFVTQRNGRFVLPVRADHRTALEGIVHGSSASGATLFVEPLAVVGLNNDLVRLQEEEAAEEARILAELSDLARRLGPGLAAAAAAVATLDLTAAALILAADFDARPAEPDESGRLELRGARHLLLADRMRSQGGRPVPIDLELDREHRVLVISGPNTGGKTVALKTVGLAVLMTQAGLPVPAERARLPVFRQVLADIGDHQSIAEDLSTFSSHIRALVRMTGPVADPALVLVDELGTGTDPDEGAALGIAVVEHFRQRGGFVLVTTHHNGLKAYAEVTAGVVNASVEFDEATLHPTYRLLQGVAGRSGGLDMAARLGLPPALVAAAREHLSEGGRLTERYVARLADLAAAAEQARRDADTARAEAEAEAREARQARQAARDEASREAAAVVEEARRRMERAARQSLEQLESELGRERRRQAEARAREEFSRQARRELGRLTRPAGEPAAPAGSGPVRWREGDRVVLTAYGREGIVERVDGPERLTVALGATRLSVASHEVRAAGSRPEAGRVSGPTASEDSAPGELNLLGRRVEEALAELDRYLDRALIGSRPEVRVVHGHGTGRLKAAVRAHLSGHPAVAGHRPGEAGEGGDGATVVRLAR